MPKKIIYEHRHLSVPFPEALKGFCDLWTLYPFTCYECIAWWAELSAPSVTQEKIGHFPGLENRYVAGFKFTTIFFTTSFQEIMK